MMLIDTTDIYVVHGKSLVKYIWSYHVKEK